MTTLFRKKVSLALGSGSAKGIAHIGVIDALQEEDYTITAISGSSAGAIVGAYFAAGKLDVFRNYLLNLNFFTTFLNIDFGIGGGGLASGNRLQALFTEHLGDITFADLRIPLYITATDIDKAESLCFQEGAVVPALRASMSIPGLFEPYEYQGKTLIDGAVTDPVPMKPLIKNGHKRPIAVDLQRHIVTEFSKTDPGTLSVVNRSILIMSRETSIMQLQDYRPWVTITPKLSHISMMDYHNAEEIIAEGYRATKAALKNLGPLDHLFA